MTKKIRPTEATLPLLRDRSACLERLDPAQVQEALGAESSSERLETALAPITLFAVRQELVKRLHSRGGRPGLAGVTRRAKIPLKDEEWLQLEELAVAISSPGFAPSAGQLASALLTLSIHSIASRAASETTSSSFLRELAAQTAASTHGDEC